MRGTPFVKRLVAQLVHVNILDTATRLAAQTFLAALPLLFALAAFGPDSLRNNILESLRTVLGVHGESLDEVKRIFQAGSQNVQQTTGGIGIVMTLVSATVCSRVLQRLCERSWHLPRARALVAAWRWLSWLLVWLAALLFQGRIHAAFGAGSVLGTLLSLLVGTAQRQHAGDHDQEHRAGGPQPVARRARRRLRPLELGHPLPQLVQFLIGGRLPGRFRTRRRYVVLLCLGLPGGSSEALSLVISSEPAPVRSDDRSCPTRVSGERPSPGDCPSGERRQWRTAAVVDTETSPLKGRLLRAVAVLEEPGPTRVDRHHDRIEQIARRILEGHRDGVVDGLGRVVGGGDRGGDVAAGVHRLLSDGDIAPGVHGVPDTREPGGDRGRGGGGRTLHGGRCGRGHGDDGRRGGRTRRAARATGRT
jgi:hypothetical protein